MENTNNDCLPKKGCQNYEVASLIHADIAAGLELLQEEADLEIEQEIARRKSELKALCASCPLSGFNTDQTDKEILSEEKDERQVLRSMLGRQANYNHLLRLAREFGLSVIEGGKHPYQIEGFDGSKLAVPCHPGNLSPKVISSARRFFAPYAKMYSKI